MKHAELLCISGIAGLAILVNIVLYYVDKKDNGRLDKKYTFEDVTSEKFYSEFS